MCGVHAAHTDVRSERRFRFGLRRLLGRSLLFVSVLSNQIYWRVASRIAQETASNISVAISGNQDVLPPSRHNSVPVSTTFATVK